MVHVLISTAISGIVQASTPSLDEWAAANAHSWCQLASSTCIGPVAQLDYWTVVAPTGATATNADASFSCTGAHAVHCDMQDS